MKNQREQRMFFKPNKHVFSLGTLLAVLCVSPIRVSMASESDLTNALQNTYTSCVGIDSKLESLKKMAGINTAITGVGTGLGVGATAVGIVKSKRDKEIEEITAKLDEMGAIEIKTEGQLYDVLAQLMDETGHAQGKEMANALRREKERKERQSKKLGNWRTGLLAANTATNIAGAVIAAKNRTDGDLQSHIDRCKSSLSQLSRIKIQAELEGIDTSEASAILNACNGFNSIDLSKINNRATGAMAASTVGAVTGLTGTITSAAANSDSIRNDNSDSGKQREKNLNTASNVLAGTSTVASATATIFNATQIKAIKDVVAVATTCTGVLQ